MANLKLTGRDVLAGFAMLALSVFPAHAQQDRADLETSLEAEQLLPEVEVRGGPRSWRKGLAAYNRGDYPEAERFFRSYRNLLGTDTLSVNLSAFDNGSTLGNNGALVFNPGIPGSRSASGSFSRIRENERKRAGRAQSGISSTERSRARASYAVGASLIKQQKFSEAKRYFSSALGLDHTLHDARLRLGLIALVEDDKRGAARRLQQLENWCENQPCGGTDELSVSVQTLRAAIESFDAVSAEG